MATRTALLIIDMQSFFEPMTSPPMLTNLTKLSTHFRSKGSLQIFTRHGHSQDELSGTTKNQLVRKWGAAGSIAYGSPDWELMPQIQKLADANRDENETEILAKNTYDSFINTKLEEVLREKGV
ncbi:hypothetical protein LTS18_003423, partial [Coniosporium uncinatum]